jgi:hypothetical protein
MGREELMVDSCPLIVVWLQVPDGQQAINNKQPTTNNKQQNFPWQN